MRNENMIEPQNPQCVQTSVKSRFFAKYWGTKTMYVGGVGFLAYSYKRMLVAGRIIKNKLTYKN